MEDLWLDLLLARQSPPDDDQQVREDEGDQNLSSKSRLAVGTYENLASGDTPSTAAKSSL
jgi:hypothetical protein